MNISFIGFGHMAKAMAKGLMPHKALRLRAASPSVVNGLYDENIKTYADNLAVLPNADVIILAVKPKEMEHVVSQIKAHLPEKALIITIAASLSLSWFAKRLPNRAIVRAMPNIAASLATSATPLIANEFVTNAQKLKAEQLFTSLGIITWVVDEREMDIFTACSGSGPAYIFKFMESMINAAKALGITDEVAKTFTLQTFKGALSLAAESNLTIADLRKSVTSAGGTTAAALDVFKQHGFDELIYEAIHAAFERAYTFHG